MTITLSLEELLRRRKEEMKTSYKDAVEGMANAIIEMSKAWTGYESFPRHSTGAWDRLDVASHNLQMAMGRLAMARKESTISVSS